MEFSTGTTPPEATPNPFRITSDQQAGRLPITRASKGLDSTRVILGLKNFGFFWVFGAALVVLVPTGNFPGGCVAAAAAWVIIKRFIDQKPRGYLMDMILAKLWWPKLMTHRPRIRIKMEDTKRYVTKQPIL